MKSIFIRGWFQIGFYGIVLFIILDLVFRFTGNSNYLPSYLLLGAFIVPVAFAAYFYRQESVLDQAAHSHISLTMIIIIFLIGGLIGTIIAGVLEDLVTFDSNLPFYLSIAGIEEFSKLLFPIAIFLLFKQYRSEVDGLVFGIAAGIGFAALETMLRLECHLIA